VVQNGATALKMPNPNPNHPVYAGEFRHAVDAKNRVTIPSRWRSDTAGEEFFAVPDPRGDYLMILPPSVFERVKENVEANTSIAAADRRKFIRRFYAQAQLVGADKQGRVLLPEEHCRRLGLEGEVVLSGSHDRIEIWNTNRWTSVMADDEEVFRRVAEEVGL